MLAASLIDYFFLFARWRLKVEKAEERKICSQRRVRFRPRFFRSCPEPSDEQWPGPSPRLRCWCWREGGKNRRRLPDEIPAEFPGRCRRRGPLRNLAEKHFDGGARRARVAVMQRGAPTCAARRGARLCLPAA